MDQILSKAVEVIVHYWPVALAILVTFVTLYPIRPIFNIYGPRLQWVMTRAAEFIIGYAATYICLRSFTEMDLDQVRYLSLFVGLFNPALYFLLMLYLQLKRPETYAKLKAVLKRTYNGNGIEEVRDENNKLDKIRDHGKTVWKRDGKD